MNQRMLPCIGRNSGGMLQEWVTFGENKSDDMNGMKNMVYAVLVCALLLSGKVCAGNPVCSDESLRSDAEKLLVEWVDTLLAYQCDGVHPALDGGFLCPACARIHGRIGDTVLPLMYLADKTGKDSYLLAAKKLMKWMENVHRPDGSWMNDVHVSDWSGTTVFAAIALYEAVHYHGHLLDDSTRNHWKKQLLEAGEFMMRNPQMYSRRMQGKMQRLNNVNYSASVTYALQALGEMFNRPDFLQEAKTVASDLKHFFTANDCFLYGEGPKIWSPTKNGCLPVDLGYNIEESLPNLAYYALMVNDRELLAIVERSMDTHLEFMLPDGAWDNSWGTRCFKWTYWGGRTSDGFMGGYYALAERHPEYLEAIRRNIQLLRKSTADGLLHAGRDYRASGMPACIHHTFGHAKALTAFLELPPATVLPERLLPRDAAYGVRFFQDIRTWLVAEGAWRATFTGYDAEYKVKGTHPMGGAVSLLWHEQAGPVFAATMNRYTLIEAPNMQSNRRKYIMSGTPRVEMTQYGTVYSNLDDLDTDITYIKEKDAHRFRVNTHLVDVDQQAPVQGPVSVNVDYTYSKHGMTVQMEHCPYAAYLVLPVIASPTDVAEIGPKDIRIRKSGGTLQITCINGELKVAPTDDDGRIFNPVPGFSFIPLQVFPEGASKKIVVKIMYN